MRARDAVHSLVIEKEIPYGAQTYYIEKKRRLMGRYALVYESGGMPSSHLLLACLWLSFYFVCTTLGTGPVLVPVRASPVPSVVRGSFFVKFFLFWSMRG